MTLLFAKQAVVVQRAPAMVASAAGAVLWLLSLPLLAFDLARCYLLLATLVLVPLGISCIDWPSPWSRSLGLLQLASRVQLPAAALLIGAMLLQPGSTAALLTLPWLAVTLILAAYGGKTVAGGWKLREAHGWPQQVGMSAALMMLGVGGAFVTISRGGWQPLGFDSVIVELTAIHFHYAGFVLPLIAACIARAAPGPFSTTAVVASTVAVPVVAVGIAFSPLVELVGAAALLLACWSVAGLQLHQSTTRATSPSRLVLLAVSGLSLAAAMCLAMIYAVGEYLHLAWLDIPTMIAVHGTANAIGFGLCGLLAWTLSPNIPQRRDAWE